MIRGTSVGREIASLRSQQVSLRVTTLVSILQYLKILRRSEQ
jgi:hypothetical protein